MNNGKICVSVYAETADEFIKKIKQAAEMADVIELRFDFLPEVEIDKVLSKSDALRQHIQKPFLFTFRPAEQGGMRKLTFNERASFWNRASDSTESLVDVETDIIGDPAIKSFETRICSHHDFTETPSDLPEIYTKIKKTQADIVKIAVQTDDITASIPIWKLLEKARSENVKLIPIAMGEAGKWTRILSLAHGSPMTYSSLESGNETAPGQFSVDDMINVYRVKELNEQTEIYGIIGNPVSHSLSPYMHNAAFAHHNLNAVYIPFEVSNLDEFIVRMVRQETREINWNLKGLSVTIPHKETIIKHLDFISGDAKKIGAVNTVKIIDGKLHGYNTDADGFIEPLQNSYGNLKDSNVGIIGNGGAARACVYALKKCGANITIFARDPSKALSLAKEFNVKLEDIKTLDSGLSGLDCLVNTTPLGTVGELENETPLSVKQIKNIQLAYDLVYNPFETLFLREAKIAGLKTLSGFDMLVAQGIKQFELWTKLEAPPEIMKNAALLKLT